MKRVRASRAESDPTGLENRNLRLDIDEERGAVLAIHNRLTEETLAISGDGFALEFDNVVLRSSEFPDVAAASGGARERSFRFSHPLVTVQMRYDLNPEHQFAERHLTVTFARAVTLRHVTVGALTFGGCGLKLECYRYPDFEWTTAYVLARHGVHLQRPADSEPSRTFFCRTDKGGIFTGMEMPYDHSTLKGSTVRLGYAPSLKVKAGETLLLEPIYVGVYRRSERDARAAEWKPSSQLLDRVAGTGDVAGECTPVLPPVSPRVLPLPSESAAMVAMTSAILGPPRHGLQAFACGWHCQMQQAEYESDAALEGDLRSLEFIAECGLDGLTDSHPWGGETSKMAGLREGDRYVLGPRVQRVIGHARELGLKVTQWPTMNNTHPWMEYGGPFRLDRPDWLRGVEGGTLGGINADNFERREANCVACEPFFRWLSRTILDDALGTGLYESWCMDGDFWGTGAFFHSIVPVTCIADDHDHARGDANYACQRALSSLIAEVRRRHPGTYIIMCRPPMDLGVWAQRNVDACFTLIESGTGGSNIVGGDEIRSASRMRVHHQFYPHWLDQSLLFPSYASAEDVPTWPSAHIDYIVLSALSCSPNILLYLPTRTGIPAADKAQIRKWLEWGRHNAEYLLVRHDLFDWPDPGRVDGSAHIRGDQGVIFFFNPGKTPGLAEFSLTRECIGLEGRTSVEVRQEYPLSDRNVTHAPGDTVRWPVPAEAAVVLRVNPQPQERPMVTAACP